MAMQITQNNFKSEVEQSSVPVLIDFWASWCGPCKMMSPILEEVANELDGQVKVGKINVDEEGDLAQKYNIMSIPAFLVFKDGKNIAQTIGGCGKDDLKNFVLNSIK